MLCCLFPGSFPSKLPILSQFILLFLPHPMLPFSQESFLPYCSGFYFPKPMASSLCNCCSTSYPPLKQWPTLSTPKRRLAWPLGLHVLPWASSCQMRCSSPSVLCGFSEVQKKCGDTPGISSRSSSLPQPHSFLSRFCLIQ